MKPDLDKYRAMMPECGSSKAEQDDILLTLWSAMEAIVDRAFDDHPSQQIAHEAINKVGMEASDLIKSDHTLTSHTDENSAPQMVRRKRKLRRKPTKKKD